MANLFKDRVLETSTTTGTGTYTLAGAVTGFQSASGAGFTNGDTGVFYAEDVDANGVPTGGWEVFLGTWGTGGTLARTTIYASSNAGAAVNWSAGTRRIGLAWAAANTTHGMDVLTSGTTYVVPNGVYWIEVEAVGGGGSGGKNSASPTLFQPGRAGAYFRYGMAVTPGQSITYAVGAGGAAQTTNGTAGNAGGNTTWNGVQASGGAGGSASAVTANSTYPGASAPTSSGINIAGGAGYAFATSSGNFAGHSMMGEGAIRPGSNNTGLVEATGYGAAGVGGNSTIAVSGTAGTNGVIIVRY